jgi:hypothetical protein
VQGEKDLSFLCSAMIVFVSHPVSYPMDRGDSSPGLKWTASEAEYLPRSIAEL